MPDTFENLRAFLELKFRQYNSIDFIEKDPILIPHLFSKKEDVEIAGFLAASIAWGQRGTIIKNAKQLIEWMDNAPHDFIMNFKENDLEPFRNFVHRTFNGDDCEFFLWSLKNIYQKFGSLENAFRPEVTENNADTKNSILNFRQTFFELDHMKRTEKHIANPLKNSSAKRLNMFLRWMVRNDKQGVDFGIWSVVAPSQLVCPLDVHTGRVARKLGLLNRTANDWLAAKELTENLKLMDVNDPVKFDFALFGLGIFEDY
ncbi:MAG: TIGR02757 family protein [Bacteroidales bacterium]|nr:TIGR02757 family protein [Bacteroidales bacterium]